MLEKKRGKAYEQESKEIEQDDQNKLLSYSLSKRNLYTDLRIDPETNTKAVTKFVTNLLEFKMNLAGNDSLIKSPPQAGNRCSSFPAWKS